VLLGAARLCPYPLQKCVSGNTKKKLSRVSDSSVTVARDYANNTFITRDLLTTYAGTQQTSSLLL
jgi:hypothetical protein